MRYLFVAVLTLSLAAPARAETVAVAVASNFAYTLREVAAAYEAETGHRVRSSPSSSGKLFAQIMNGAPHDVFLSADAERPERLETAGRTVAGSRFTYAVGRLVLWSADARYAGVDCAAELRAGNYTRIATANPATAPYGAAAAQALATLGLDERSLRGRIAFGENVAQALQFVAGGSASIGLVARAQLDTLELPAATCAWDVPPSLHDPIAQQAVLLDRGAANPAATAFVAFLRGERARAIIRAHGYVAD